MSQLAAARGLLVLLSRRQTALLPWRAARAVQEQQGGGDITMRESSNAQLAAAGFAPHLEVGVLQALRRCGPLVGVPAAQRAYEVQPVW